MIIKRLLVISFLSSLFATGLIGIVFRETFHLLAILFLFGMVASLAFCVLVLEEEIEKLRGEREQE